VKTMLAFHRSRECPLGLANPGQLIAPECLGALNVFLLSPISVEVRASADDPSTIDK
jgi:hypothetical protein